MKNFKVTAIGELADAEFVADTIEEATTAFEGFVNTPFYSLVNLVSNRTGEVLRDAVIEYEGFGKRVTDTKSSLYVEMEYILGL